MDKYGYIMDMSKKLEFTSVVYQQIMKQLSIIDSFKGNWEIIDLKHSKHLKELRKIANYRKYWFFHKNRRCNINR